MKLVISGKFKMGSNKEQPFNMEIEAKDKNAAKEKIYAYIGAKHHCPRRFIKIEKTEELK